MKKKQLGNSNTLVSLLGLGGQGFSVPGRPSKAQSIQTIHHALDLGITFIDGSDAYCLDESEKHHNERLIAEALGLYEGDTSDVVVATKGGYQRFDGAWILNGDPQHLTQTIRESYDALGGQKPIDLWWHHRPDPNFTIEQSLSAAQSAVEQGWIKSIGVSNYSLKQLKQAQNVVDIVAVQNQFSPWHREAEYDGLLEYCCDHKISFVASSIFGSIEGARRTTPLASLSAFHAIASHYDTSTYCVILAWVMSKSPRVIPLVGARRPSSILDSAKALTLNLAEDEIRRLDQSAPFNVLKFKLKQVKNAMTAIAK